MLSLLDAARTTQAFEKMRRPQTKTEMPWSLPDAARTTDPDVWTSSERDPHGPEQRHNAVHSPPKAQSSKAAATVLTGTTYKSCRPRLYINDTRKPMSPPAPWSRWATTGDSLSGRSMTVRSPRHKTSRIAHNNTWWCRQCYDADVLSSPILRLTCRPLQSSDCSRCAARPLTPQTKQPKSTDIHLQSLSKVRAARHLIYNQFSEACHLQMTRYITTG